MRTGALVQAHRTNHWVTLGRSLNPSGLIPSSVKWRVGEGAEGGSSQSLER